MLRDTKIRSGLAVLVVLSVTSPVFAAGDADTGNQIAQRWCASCHLTGPNASGAAVQGPPTFTQMGRDRSPDALRAFLMQPHAPMPSLDLSRTDIDNLVAYIEILR